MAAATEYRRGSRLIPGDGTQEAPSGLNPFCSSSLQLLSIADTQPDLATVPVLALRRFLPDASSRSDVAFSEQAKPGSGNPPLGLCTASPMPLIIWNRTEIQLLSRQRLTMG